VLPAALRVAPAAYDAITWYGIAGLAVAVAAAFVLLFSRGRPPRRLGLAAGAGVVMAVSAAIASSGQLARFDRLPPPMFVMLVFVLGLGLWLGFSRIGGDAATDVPLAWLVGLQAFRLPLELVMHRAYDLGIMPVELSYSGFNFDIVTGTGAALLSLAMACGIRVPRSVVFAWNIWGFWCLVVIAVIAVATSPMVRLFGDAPAHLNTWVLYFPYVWLPVVLVTVALAGHVTVARALRRRSRPV
jgi:hypothetical protein